MKSLYISPIAFLEKYWNRELDEKDISIYLKGLTKKELIELEQSCITEGEKIIVDFANSTPTPSEWAIHEAISWRYKLWLKIIEAEHKLDELPLTAFQIKDEKNRGRHTRPFIESIIDDTGNKKLNALHRVMHNKKGKGAALVMMCAKELGWITEVTSAQVLQEFGDIGNASGFNRYYNNPTLYKKDEIEGMKLALEEALNCLPQ